MTQKKILSTKKVMESWPALPLEEWEDTYATVHLWMQIIGKIRLALDPMKNHWWQATFYISARGLTTSAMPYQDRTIEIIFDFCDHTLYMETSDGRRKSFPLKSQTVAHFYQETLKALRSLGIEVSIWTTPVEIVDRTPFEKDHKHCHYDRVSVQKWWQIMMQVERVMKIFSSRFRGKASPVHLFWGALDLAVTRFSGRTAPEHPGAPNVGKFVMTEAYSREVSSCGFWPGAGVGAPMFYAYAYPQPKGFSRRSVKPKQAYYDENLGEFLLPYEVVRTAKSPDAVLLHFFQSTYEAAADLAKWDRKTLEY